MAKCTFPQLYLRFTFLQEDAQLYIFQIGGTRTFKGVNNVSFISPDPRQNDEYGKDDGYNLTS